MPTITIRDGLGVEILSANPQANSGFAKYLPDTPAALLAGVGFAGELRKSLALASPGENAFRLSFERDVPLGIERSLTVAADSLAVFTVYNRPGTSLFEDVFVGPSINVPAGQAYLAFAFHPTLAVGLAREVGPLSFGFDAGTDAEWCFYRPFDVMSADTTFADAARQVLETFAVPSTVDDLKAMQTRPVGTIATVSGHGQLQIACSVDVASAFNPLASVDTIRPIGTLTVGGGASARVGVAATVSGDFQIRAHKVADARVRLSYHRVAARALDITLDGSAGPAVTLGDRDLLAMLFGGPGGIAGAAEEDLVAAGISTAQLDRLKTVMAAGLSRKLSLELAAAFSTMKQDEAAFLYEIDLSALDVVGTAALDRALAGNLASLNALEPELPAHGISLLQSRIAQLRSSKIQWRLNLVGLVNVLSMRELVREGSVFHDDESGELVITDKVTSERVGALTRTSQIRKLLYESVMLTATYKASGLDPNTHLSAAQTFFDLDKNANRQRMSDYLDAVAAVGLIPAGHHEIQLGAVDDFGRASLLLETEYDQAACERLFSDEGTPRDQPFYEDVGKLALLALVQESDPDAYRRIPLLNGSLWQKMRHGESADFRVVLPPPITGGSPEAQALHVAVVTADYSLIVWWAKAMASAARALGEMRSFLDGPPAVRPDAHNPEFERRRRTVSEAMVTAVQRNASSFGDPWGLVAMFYASKRSAVATGAVVSSALTLFLPE